MRSGEFLAEAVRYMEESGIELYGINHNPDQDSWTDSPKAYGQYYIDDAAVGCPLTRVYQERSYVNWRIIREYFEKEILVAKILGK